MLPHVLQCVVCLAQGGAERVALTIIDKSSVRFKGSICALTIGTGTLIPELQRLSLAQNVLCRHNPDRIEAWTSMYRLLIREKVDVVHIHASYLLSFILPPAMLAGVRVVFTEHSEHALSQYVKLRSMTKMALPFVDSLTCISDDLRYFLIRTLNVSSNAVSVIQNGVDIEYFSRSGCSREELRGNLLPQSWCDNDYFVFCNVSRFTDAKDHLSLLNAFNAVRKYNSLSRLLLVGDGEERSAIERVINELELHDFVHLAGMRQDVPDVLSLADAFVLSSKHEGMPLVILEAMSVGLPVLTTDVGGIAEVVTNGVSACIVPPCDSIMLSKSMIWMMENPVECDKIARSGMELVRERFSHTKMVERYLELYT